jgi:NAD(P)-dependent dehydrogenase (short-subunit alcohol dehydrogenase family)
MTMAVLTTQTVAIVGASSGIGLAAAVAAAGEGARVVMLSRSQTKLEQAANAVSGQRRVIAMDMLDRTAVDRAIGSIGTIDHLVTTAVGDEYALFASIADLSTEQVERSLDKVRGFVNVTRAAAPLMRERGSITLVSGAGAFKPSTHASLAAAANGAIVSFGRSLSIELAPVRVNVLMPGVVNTPLHGDRRDAIRAASESSLPAHRFGEPEDLAHAILFLMTNPYVTGHTLIVDGGLLAS